MADKVKVNRRNSSSMKASKSRPANKVKHAKVVTEKEAVTSSLGQTPPITLANRLQRTRQKVGLSVRELADKAGVNKDTIVKLEKGHTPSYRTLCRVCDALGITVVQILKPEADDEFLGTQVAVYTASQSVESGKGKSTRGTARVRKAESRQVLADDASVKLSWLACRLPGGQMNSWMLELHGPTEPTTHAGEEFVFCLKGALTLTVSGVSYELSEGDAATFWCAEPHNYAPAPSVKPSQLPVMALSVWISALDK